MFLPAAFRCLQSWKTATKCLHQKTHLKFLLYLIKYSGVFILENVKEDGWAITNFGIIWSIAVDMCLVLSSPWIEAFRILPFPFLFFFFFWFCVVLWASVGWCFLLIKIPHSKSLLKIQNRGAWPAQLVQHKTFDLEIMSSSPTLGKIQNN